MFHFDRGLKLTKPDLAVDIRRRQPRGFISHAHHDHMARHEYTLCTPATARLYQHLLGSRPVRELPYGETLAWRGVRLTTYPAGHCLGSAMLLAEDDGRRLLYTGDFKLARSATAGGAELPEADVLILECTYGDPRYLFQPREEAAAELVAGVRAALRDGTTPVVHAYPLGKAQEVTRALTDAGLGVLVHKRIYAISRIYEDFGVALGDFATYPGRPLEGHAVIVPPRFHKYAPLPGLKRSVHFAVTGWAVADGAQHRWGVDHAIGLSDHADYEELFEAVRRVGAEEIYCTHGPATFADRLREAGFNATTLGQRAQLRLF